MKKLLLILLCLPLITLAQEVDKLKVYLDCSWRCDNDFLQREMPYIDFYKDSVSLTDLEISVTVNGIRKVLTTDYTLANGTTNKYVKFVKDLKKESKRFKLSFKEMCFGMIFCDTICCVMAYGHGYFPLLLIFFMQWLWMCYFWPKKELPAFRYSIWLVIGALCGAIAGSILALSIF